MGFIEVTLEDGRTRDIGFHVGQHIRHLAPLENIVRVQLDGDELVYLINHFANIPYNRSARVHNWRGDMAKFIVENWE